MISTSRSEACCCWIGRVEDVLRICPAGVAVRVVGTAVRGAGVVITFEDDDSFLEAVDDSAATPWTF